MIWYKTHTVEEINVLFDRYMTQHLGVKVIEILDDGLVATMPVTDKVRQPFGILHGGASVVLAESLGSVASNLCVNPEKWMGVGMEINANHLRSVKDGFVKAVCTAIRLGRTTHVWDIKIYDAREKLICISRHTVAIIAQRGNDS